MNPFETRNRDYLILLLILIIAALTRAWKLDSSLWFDEIFTVIEYARLSFTDLFLVDSSFNNHPFYSLSAKVSALLFGESNWSVRLPAALFGIAGIALTWRLACRVTGVLQAHICALLLALSYHHVWFSQNARGYTLLMFWCVASTLVLLDCLRSPSWKRWIAYGLLMAAGLYTHLTAAFFFLAQAIIVGFVLLGKSRAYPVATFKTKKQKWQMPLMGYLVGSLVTLLLYSPSIVHLYDSVMLLSDNTAVYPMPEYRSPAWAALEIVRSFARPGPVTSLVALAVIFLTGTGMVSVYRKEPLVPVLLVLHVTITIAILMALSMRMWPRFFFVDIGFVLLFITQGVFVCCRKITAFWLNKSRPGLTVNSLFLAASTLMMVFSGFLLMRNYQFPKQDFESSIQYINETKQQKDKVLTLDLATDPYNRFYAQDWPAITSEQELREIQNAAGATWLVVIFPSRTTRKYDGIMRYVEKNYSLAKTFRGTLGDGNILVYTSGQQD